MLTFFRLMLMGQKVPSQMTHKPMLKSFSTDVNPTGKY